MGSTILFIHLKLFYYSIFSFQFSVSANISCIQMDPLFPLKTNVGLFTKSHPFYFLHDLASKVKVAYS